MKKIWIITAAIVLVIAITLGLVFGLRSCGKPAASLTNENGTVIEGGEFEKGSVLNVDKIENTAADADTVIAKIEASGVAIKDTENVYIYDISVTKNDVEVQPSGKVKVTVPAPNDEKATGYDVYHLKANGETEKLPATLADGKISFETESFSPFAFVPTYNYVYFEYTSMLYVGASHVDFGSVTVNGKKMSSFDQAQANKIARGKMVELEVSSVNDEYTFIGWFEADSFYMDNYDKPTLKATPVSTELSYKFEMPETDYALYACFDRDGEIFTIGATPSNGGSIAVGGTAVESGKYYRDDWTLGKTYTLAAEAKEGFRFKFWSVNGFFTSYTVEDASFDLQTRPGVISATAIFEPVVTKLTVNMDSNLVYDPNLGGAVPNFDAAEVSSVNGAGATVKLTADQYTVDKGGFDATKPGTYTVTYTYKENTDIKTTVTVTVLSRKVNITVKNEGKGGTADHLGKNTVDLGSAMTLTATLESEDYEFLGWYLSDGTMLSSELVYTFNAETNMIITAKFKLDKAALVTVSAIRDFEFITNQVVITINGVRIENIREDYVLGDVLKFGVANVPSHYTFLGWYIKDADQEENKFPSSDIAPVMQTQPLSTERSFQYEITSEEIEIYAVFVNAGEQFNIRTEDDAKGIVKDGAGNEMPSVFHEDFVVGKTYALTAEPKEGYEFVCWEVLRRRGASYVLTEQTINYTTDLYSYEVCAVFKPAVTGIKSELNGTILCDPSVSAEYKIISIPQFIEYCKQGNKGEFWKTKFIIVGRVKSISSTEWGNMYIEDSDGNKLHLYGVYGENEEQFNTLPYQPVVGDYIAVYGEPYLYMAEPEMKEAYLLGAVPTLPDFEKVKIYSTTVEGDTLLVKDTDYTVDLGGLDVTKPGVYTVTYTYIANPELKATVTVTVLKERVTVTVEQEENTEGTLSPIGATKVDKGTEVTLTATPAEGWIFEGWFLTDGTKLSGEATYTFTANENLNVIGKFNIVVTNIVTDAENTVYDPNGGHAAISIPQFNEYCLAGEAGEHWGKQFVVVGKITEIDNSTWGNLYIEDEEGNTLYVYGTYDESGEIRYDALADKPVVGDVVTLRGTVYQYNATPQLKNAQIIALPDFANANVYGVTVDGNQLLVKDVDYTVDLGGLDVTKPGTYTVTYTYTANHELKATVTVTVLKESVTVKVEQEENTEGTLSPIGATKVDKGTEITLTATPAEGWVFEGWFLTDGTKLSGEATYTFTANENLNVIGKFERTGKVDLQIHTEHNHEYDTIGATIRVNGLALGDPSAEYYVGDKVQISLSDIPSDMIFLGWYEVEVKYISNSVKLKKEPLSLEQSFEYELTSENAEIYAVFDRTSRIVIITMEDPKVVENPNMGVIRDDDGNIVNIPWVDPISVGKVYNLTATANEGYEFLYWIVYEEVEKQVITDPNLIYKVNHYSAQVCAVFRPVVTGLTSDVTDTDYIPATGMQMPDFANAKIYAVTAESETLLVKDVDYTVDLGGLDKDKPGIYTVTYTYTANPEIKLELTVKVYGETYFFGAYVENGTLFQNGKDIGPDYSEEFNFGAGEVTLTAKGDDGTVFLGWFTSEDVPTLISTEETYTFTVDGEIRVFARYEYPVEGLHLDGMNMGFNTIEGTTVITVPCDRTYDVSRILVSVIRNGEPEWLDPSLGAYTVDAGGFDGENPQPGTYTVTFTYVADPTIKATHIIRVIDAVNVGISAESGGMLTVTPDIYGGVAKGTDITMSIELRSEEDYEFLGWYKVVYGVTEADSSETLLSADRTYTMTVEESMDIVAKIEPKITYLEVEGFDEPWFPEAKFGAYADLFAADRGGVYACGALGKRIELNPDQFTIELGGLDLANPVAGVYDVTFTYNADTSVSKTVKVHVWNEDHSFRAYSNNSDYGYLFFDGETLNGVEAGGQYPHLWLVEIRAIAKPGCEFEGWYLVKNMETHVDYEFLSAEETYSFEITEDTVLEARFKEASNG